MSNFLRKLEQLVDSLNDVPFSSLNLSYSRSPFDSEQKNESKRSSRHEQELTFLTYDLKCFVLYVTRNVQMELFRTNNEPWYQQQNPLKKLQGFFRLPVIQNSSASVPPEWQSHFHRGETTAVLFVLICGIPLTFVLRGEWPSCIKLN